MKYQLRNENKPKTLPAFKSIQRRRATQNANEAKKTIAAIDSNDATMILVKSISTSFASMSLDIRQTHPHK